MEPEFKYEPIRFGQPTAIYYSTLRPTPELAERFEILAEILGGDFRPMHDEINERIGRALFRIPTPRCNDPYVPPILTAAEELAMEEVMDLFRNSDF